MPTFLVQASYTAEGAKGLQHDGAAARLAAVQKVTQSLGGTLHSMHFALGADDVVIIIDLPDAGSAAAMGVAIGATGLVTSRTTALLTVAEMDEGLSRRPDYRAPGQ